MKNINLEIHQGEYASFLGQSGCGKSTLLYVVSGIDRSSSGRVLISNQDLTKFDERQSAYFRQNGIGFVFQNFNLIPSLKIVDNVALPMNFMGVLPAKRKERAMQLLKRLEIDRFANRYPYELSGGQQQRVGIARALANDPPIILADEPIGNLDTANALIVLDILKDINKKEGKTVVIVTHEPWSLRDVTKIFKMKDGQITEVEEKHVPESGDNGTTIGDRALPVEAQAKMLTELLFSGHTHEEINRAENFIMQRLKNEITSNDLKTDLDQSFKNKGVGLWKGKAVKISEEIEEFLDEKKEIAKLASMPKTDVHDVLQKKVDKVRAWLLEDVQSKLSPEKLQQLTGLISDRVRGVISREDFAAQLNESEHKGGIGLHIQSVIKISEKMDILIA